MAYRIVRNDITKIEADAIVNSANPDPTFMAGTDSAIYMAAGAEKLLKEREKIGTIEEGQVAVTPAFDLPAKYIFHTVAPFWYGGENGERETVKACYLNCLKKAAELGIESIAFPLIATGVYGLPKAEGLLIATAVFSSFLADNELDITLVVFDNESFTLSGKIFAGVDQYIDENYVEAKINEEYEFGMIETCEDAELGDASDALNSAVAAGTALGAAPDADAAPDAVPKDERRPRNQRPRGLFHSKKQMMDSMPAESAVEPAAAPVLMASGAAKAAPRSLDDVVKNLSETWSESLLRLIREKGYDEVEVYKRANADRKLFSKIRSKKDYKPKKETALAFALALRLNYDETIDFLRLAGYALSPSNLTDVIVEYFIKNGVFEIYTINLELFSRDLPILG